MQASEYCEMWGKGIRNSFVTVYYNRELMRFSMCNPGAPFANMVNLNLSMDKLSHSR